MSSARVGKCAPPLGMKPEPLVPPPVPKTRQCLKCRKPFRSSGLFICPRCTDENQTLNMSKREITGVVRSGG